MSHDKRLGVLQAISDKMFCQKSENQAHWNKARNFDIYF